MNRNRYSAFTIVELLIVIVIIAILATITIVAYNGITNRAHKASIQSDLNNGSKLLSIFNTINGTYPANLSAVNNGQAFKTSGDNYPVYNTNAANDAYCLETHYPTTNPTMSFFVTSIDTTPQQGTCNGVTGNPGGAPFNPIVDGDIIQTITSANCPTTRVRAVDARDNHTYWVQKLADGKCWMLTNLAYAGDGVNTYSDAVSAINLTQGTSGNTYTDAKYYIPAGSNVTSEPATPSTSTNGTGQYGYIYNWCAAMGAQIGTSTCSSTTDTDNWNHSISICPAGWRLPTGVSGSGEFTILNNVVNGGSSTSDAGLLSGWLAQRGGYWSLGFSNQSSYGYYWSSSQSTANKAYYLNFHSPEVYPAFSEGKYLGLSVRCITS